MGGGKRSYGNPGGSLGKSLNNARDKKFAGSRKIQHENETHLHTSEIHQKEAHQVDMKVSSTEPDYISDFLATVQMQQREFEVEAIPNSYRILQPDRKDFSKVVETMSELTQDILIPRRPVWTEETTKEELDRAEKDAFLTWRRELAEVEESSGNIFTPFEKNIEFWRQLWRVIERSDLVVQLVDARRPLLYYCADVDTYVDEVSERQNAQKETLLLINKADLISEYQRKVWAEYFEREGIEFIFFSAVEEQEKFEDDIENLQKEEDIEDDPEEKEIVLPDNNWEIYDKDQFNLFVKLLREGKRRRNDEHVTVGMIGYPNVGKSSCINVMLQDKKVSVSATPGKTKHFQTLKWGDDIVLCDCPGLVFPSQVSTKEELVLAGILPLNHIRDHITPVALMCQLIEKRKLELGYGIHIMLFEDLMDTNPDRAPTAGEFLDPMAAARGFRTTHGQPDRSRAARLAIKDFISGKLLHVHEPPGYKNKQEFQESTLETEKDLAKLERRIRIVETKMLASWKLDKIDRAFFGQTDVKAVEKKRMGADGKYLVTRKDGKQRLQDLKPKKKDKQRRVREKALKEANKGLPDWL
ncbi:unnamed protein product [Oikopleura dioica]|uniref:Large subunit GTPase 1 homolog n=1 Tax=Oikopleura dioica TaxID=34765 RepID=E4WRP1_OIKDI|nr:unnamed protein product [Oikopleura dioica]